MPRNKTYIDWKRVEQMAMAGSNGVQIAAAIGVHYDTLVNRFKTDFKDEFSDFSEFLRTKREKGNDLLLRKQFDIAMKGDKTMLVWLGKQRLGQREKSEIETNQTINNTHSIADMPKEKIKEINDILNDV